ncbi:MAG: BACON domain-containing protein [bacterium]|nr:BACON domain-containing protein [bacterium]
MNPRYYSSAATMWTADVYSDVGLGVTLYDVNLLTWIARTTLYGISGADALSDNWAALEYNPEVIPSTYVGSATLSGSSTHYSQMIRLYNGNPHVISFFKWKNQGGSDYQFKETTRGTALKQFFDAVKDKARQSVSTVFTPKEVENASVSYSTLTALVYLSWSEKIWTNKSYLWTDWGDFQEFVIYRGYSEDFTADAGAEIVRQSSSSYIDTTFDRGVTVYYKIAAVNSNGVVGPVQELSVDVPEGNPIPVMSVSRDRLNFAYVNGGSNPPTQDYRISNNGTGALTWTAVDDAEWLTCDPDSGINGAVVTVTADPTGLAIGTYSSTITIDDPQATNSPQTITVYLTVKSSNQNQLPFGDFSTPADGSTVSSSVPVTGWVLDDVGVESVKIYRDPIEGEGTGIIYIGDALFVEGARSDIEAAYPDYPANYMAGWGYMLLTNFLPNGGNGTFTLYAIAKDTFGYEVTLGTKTITCDNANAVKPFGAIDSPAPGGTASGSSYRNNGWALTPMPNSIPTNGATLDVYIDGVNRGHPVYNVYRSDIAGLFAGYANSGGAGGYFEFDTRQFSDGIHTIAWIAEDFAGNSDGIGSRFFTVDNTGSSSRTTSTTSTPWSPDPKLLSTALAKLPPDSTSPLGVVKGFKKNAELRKNYPNAKGITNLRIKEMQRVEIHLDTGTSGKSLYWSGALTVNNNLRKLPVGSTLDAEKGIFYWQPGLAFMGNYTLEFIGFDNTTGKMRRKQVKITIVPGK